MQAGNKEGKPGLAVKSERSGIPDGLRRRTGGPGSISTAATPSLGDLEQDTSCVLDQFLSLKMNIQKVL